MYAFVFVYLLYAKVMLMQSAAIAAHPKSQNIRAAQGLLSTVHPHFCMPCRNAYTKRCILPQLYKAQLKCIFSILSPKKFYHIFKIKTTAQMYSCICAVLLNIRQFVYCNNRALPLRRLVPLHAFAF